MELRGAGVGDYGYFYYWTGEFSTNKYRVHDINLIPNYSVELDRIKSGDFKAGDWVYSKAIHDWVIMERAWIAKTTLEHALDLWKFPHSYTPDFEKDPIIKGHYHEIEAGWRTHEILIVPSGWLEYIYPYGYMKDLETGNITLKMVG